MSDLNISVEAIEPITIIAISGRIDSSNNDKLYPVIEENIKNGHYNLILDLTNTRFISSTGLCIFIKILGECKKNNGDVRLIITSSAICNTMEVIGLHFLFQIFDNKAAAVDSFNSHATRMSQDKFPKTITSHI